MRPPWWRRILESRPAESSVNRGNHWSRPTISLPVWRTLIGLIQNPMQPSGAAHLAPTSKILWHVFRPDHILMKSKGGLVFCKARSSNSKGNHPCCKNTYKQTLSRGIFYLTAPRDACYVTFITPTDRSRKQTESEILETKPPLTQACMSLLVISIL